ncbi:hypothetical protein JGS22_024685 [Streptomyces sp. P38-E01]|uniref:Uncharacterized protein n=1 Tax=Streptomyces tardus TaxID=2780544 RepID=A0A949JT30_9ACTN|nr:hypothetical protein [Streptomyces tardus]MBU7600736.1 hypothetical protein [Streptomyces tardus]
MNPYNRPSPPPRPPDLRPLRRRKRVWGGGVGLLLFGALLGSAGEQPDSTTALGDSVKPTPTLTATVEATTTERVTVEPDPAPTVTRTRTVKTPGPTVTVTSAPGGSGTGAGGGTGSGSGGSVSGGGGTGGGAAASCSLVSNAGNCYSPGQFCRTSDHGASTTTSSGTRITCRQNGDSWRWTRS